MQKNSELRVLGMMSGTSLDGLDLVLCRFSAVQENISFRIEAAGTVAYPRELYNRINDVFQGSARELAALDADLGKWMGQAAAGFLKGRKADLISSHGHTIFHHPAGGMTFQAGSGAHIAMETGLPVVNDLRRMDVAAGGQGAPLVPVGDGLLFPEYAACLNLGGFSNISFEKKGSRKAFDICPVNFLLNRAAHVLGHAYDEGGNLARKGKVLAELLDQLNQLEFYNETGPKSLGREQVEALYMPLLEPYLEKTPYDLLKTLCMHIAAQISRVINDNVKAGKILVTGGGALNTYLVELLREKTQADIAVPDLQLINFKEGLIFALLGYLRMQNKNNALPSVTGAGKPTIGGAIWGDFSLPAGL